MAFPPPKPGSLALALIPFAALGFSVPAWDRVEPRIAGLPFNLCWIVAWIVLTPVCLLLAYRRDRRG